MKNNILSVLLILIWVLIKVYIINPQMTVLLYAVPILSVSAIWLKITKIKKKKTQLAKIKRRFTFNMQSSLIQLTVVLISLAIIAILNFEEPNQIVPITFLVLFYLSLIIFQLIENKLGFYNISFHHDHLSINKPTPKLFYYQYIKQIKFHDKKTFTLHDRFGNIIAKIRVNQLINKQQTSFVKEMEGLIVNLDNS